MSTRSGKRIHNVSNENLEPELAVKSDRKMRTKHIAEDGGGSQGIKVKTKKRQNYVSFPAEETSTDVVSTEEEQAKPARALRRYTLKEQNAATEDVDTGHIEATKKQARSTRRTKKVSETEEEPNIPVIIEEVVTITKSKDKKNKKKSKKLESEFIDKENVKLGKKKKNKKKKNSQSSVIEQEESKGKRKNDSNVSTDSFHSAAGSPQLKPTSAPSALNIRSPKQSTDTKALSTNNSGEKKKRQSSLRRISEHNTSTKAMEVDDDTNIVKEPEMSTRASKRRRTSLKPVMTEKEISDTNEKVDPNATFEKEPVKVSSAEKKRKSNLLVENPELLISTAGLQQANLDISQTSKILNTTFEKEELENGKKTIKSKKSDSKNHDIHIDANANVNSSFEIRRSPRKSLNSSEKITLNGTFDLSPKPDLSNLKSHDSTYDKESKLDTTFDKTNKPSLGSKSSLISSDATNNSIISLDKSDNSKITDDDSKTENILNTTPLLIESSMEESKVLESSVKEKTPESQPKCAVTPLKREGTFTKDSPSMSPKQTPNKRQTLPSAGCTPYHSNGKGSQTRSIMNRTHSIEKPGRPWSPAETEAPRAPRVMFCSPVNLPGVATQRKSKIIKSNLKGSNKSFVFDDSASLQPAAAGRKRARTAADGAAAGGPKRSRLQLEPPPRARTHSAMAKLSATPSKPATPQSEVKATKLPNFAALHARRFQRMESLDECQQRRARRARQLLAPAGSVAVLERSSPRVTLEPKPRETPPRPPSLPVLARGYTRFGFKMHCDVNPFSVPPKTTEKTPSGAKPTGRPNGVNKSEAKPNGVKPDVIPNGAKQELKVRPNSAKPIVSLKRDVTQPSLAGTTSLRRAVAKQTIMREKSFTLAEKRKETRKEVRTVIKGVRTNRRFELQMQSRNLNA